MLTLLNQSKFITLCRKGVETRERDAPSIIRASKNNCKNKNFWGEEQTAKRSYKLPLQFVDKKPICDEDEAQKAIAGGTDLVGHTGCYRFLETKYCEVYFALAR